MLKPIQVKYMRHDPFTLSPSLSVRDAVGRLLDQRLSDAPVTAVAAWWA